MRSARLSHIVHLQVSADVTDPRSGQKLKQWQTQYVVWAGIEPLRGRELYAAQQHNSEITLRIVMRWQAEIAAQITHAWEVVLPADAWNAQPALRYQILHDPINPDMSNREIHLMCKVMS